MNGTELRQRRMALNLNQAELGGRLGVSPQTVYKWEAEKVGIRHPGLLDLALRYLEQEPRRQSRTALGKALRTERLRKGLTQAWVAEQTGMTQAQMSALESGHARYPDPEWLYTLDRFYERPEGFFLGVAGQSPKPAGEDQSLDGDLQEEGERDG